MQVLKFGGSSVADASAMGKVVDIVNKALERDRTIVVASAISGCTDSLIQIGTLASQKDDNYKIMIDELQSRHEKIINSFIPEEKRQRSLQYCQENFDNLRSITLGVYILGELTKTSLDAIQGVGELLSTSILIFKFKSLGYDCKWIDSRQIIKTNNGVVDTDITNDNIEKMLSENRHTQLFIMPGFIASDQSGKMVTLGRGGSDYSASIIAVGSKARVLEIWTDVPGMMTTNPKIAPEAYPIRNISYRAALELSHFGAKVIYPPTIQPVIAKSIPIYIKDTFNPDDCGTLIESDPPYGSDRSGVIGISNSDNIALISLEGSGMVGIPGFSSRLFEALSVSGINIILITQASSVHTMCIAISEKDAEKAKAAADKTFAYEISLGKLNPLKVEKGFSIVCLVGNDILSHSGSTGRMLAALGRRGISVRATAQGSSERNISVIIESQDVVPAIQSIHREFFEKSNTKIINLFIAGYGGVGKALIQIIKENKQKVFEKTGKLINVAGLSNSRKYVIKRDGIDLTDIDNLLDNGSNAADDAFFSEIQSMSLENSIFVDCTSSYDIANKYVTMIENGYNVVACNKIAFAAPLQKYMAIKKCAFNCGRSVKYETTVGAALPILETISRCSNSGDAIHRVQAVLSGTLNYVFSTYKGSEGVSFASVIKQAQALGYTEHDPRIDLGGKDVLRKLVILCREAGIFIEESDVEISPILPKEYFDGTIDDFFNMIEKNEAQFAQQYQEAASQGLQLKFIASLENENGEYKAKIGLQKVDTSNPLFFLTATDNAAIIWSDFYTSPLVIQGAGAGTFQTASGVLNDIVHTI